MPELNDLDRVYGELRRLNDRLDTYISRTEYEARHAPLVQSQEKVEKQIDDIAKAVSTSQVTVWQYMATSLLSFVIGIAADYLLKGVIK